MKKKRPVGVTILGSCLLLCVIPGLAAAFIGAIPGGSYPKGILGITYAIMMRMLFISSPVIFLVTGIGVLKLKNWARFIAFFLSPALSYIGLGFTGMFFIKLIPNNIWAFVFSVSVITLTLVIVYYLTRPEVKRAFRRD